MSIWFKSFYDMSILKCIALKSIWHKTDDIRREVLSHWCHYLEWTGNLILPNFDLQMKLSSLSGSQSTIFDSLTMSVLNTIARTKEIVSYAEANEISIGPKAIRLHWPVLPDCWRSVEIDSNWNLHCWGVDCLARPSPNIISLLWRSQGLAELSESKRNSIQVLWNLEVSENDSLFC